MQSKKKDVTCDFEHTLGGMGDGGGHTHRRISAFLETSWLTQTLRLLQFPFTAQIFTKAWRLLSPLAWCLCLETSWVKAGAIKLMGAFAILTVPRKSTFHQRALLCISAELEREEGHNVGNHQTWFVLSMELTVLCNLYPIWAAFQWEGGRDKLIHPKGIKKNPQRQKKGEQKNVQGFNTLRVRATN